jgi:hypothetical protein
MHGTPRTLRIASQNGQNGTAVVRVVLQSVGDFNADLATASASRFSIDCSPDRCARRSRSRQSKEAHLRARYLHDSDGVFAAEPEHIAVDRRRIRRPLIASVLVQYALDHRDEPPGSRIALAFAPQVACQASSKISEPHRDRSSSIRRTGGDLQCAACRCCERIR